MQAGDCGRDEHMSSMGQERYLRETPKGIARFVPIGLRTPKGLMMIT